MHPFPRPPLLLSMEVGEALCPILSYTCATIMLAIGRSSTTPKRKFKWTMSCIGETQPAIWPASMA